MAITQHIHLLLFLLVLTTCLVIAEGRQLKAMKEHELGPVETEIGLKTHEVERSRGDQKANPHVTQQKNISQPTTPTQSHELRSSKVSRKDNFQSTTQGNSPGVGHSFPGKSPNMQPKVQDFRFTAGKADAFQATTQGHSPGVGHYVGN